MINIPYKNINISQLNTFSKNTLAETLKMEVSDITEKYFEMKMPVDSTVHQPFGVLHGGASCALAENLASLAGNVMVHGQNKACVGLSLSINHLKSIKSGWIFARATPIHLGRSTQVWQVETSNKDNELLNTCTVTLAVINTEGETLLK